MMMKYLGWIIGSLVVCGAVAFYFSVGNNDDVFLQKTLKKEEAKADAITLKIDWEIEKDFVFQVFYTTHRNENFNQKHSVKKQVFVKDKHIEVELPAEKIYKIRYDFGVKPQRVVLKNVEITGDQYINFSNWKEYGYRNMDKNKIHKEDNSLELVSDQGDPYMYFIYPFVLYKKSDGLVKE